MADSRDRLAVRDDGERLERGGREPDGVGADVASDERAALRRRWPARRGRRRADEPDASVGERDLEVAQAGIDRRRGPCRPASAISRRESGRSATNRSASRAVSVSSIGGDGPSARSTANDSSVSSSGSSSSGSGPTPAAARLAHRRASARGRRSGPTGTACSTTISRRFIELEHGQERDGDDDAIADPAEQVLEDDRRARRAGPSRMIAARSSMRDRPSAASRLGARAAAAMTASRVQRARPAARIEGRARRPGGRRRARPRARCPARAGTDRSAGSPPRPAGSPASRWASVEQESLAQRRLGIRPLVGQGGRIAGRPGAAASPGS